MQRFLDGLIINTIKNTVTQMVTLLSFLHQCNSSFVYKSKHGKWWTKGQTHRHSKIDNQALSSLLIVSYLKLALWASSDVAALYKSIHNLPECVKIWKTCSADSRLMTASTQGVFHLWFPSTTFGQSCFQLRRLRCVCASECEAQIANIVWRRNWKTLRSALNCSQHWYP